MSHNSEIILNVQGLSISLSEKTKKAEKVISTDLVKDLSFSLAKGKTLALVGESGSGKSLTAQAILKLFYAPSLYIKKGAILFQGEDLVHKNEKQMQKLRGKEIAFISQNPMSALNPTLTIGFQLMECLQEAKETAKEKSLAMLQAVGIHDVRSRFSSYPHELSGGQKQRILIAMSLINKPKLLIADEPTTALDVTLQAEILDLLRALQKKMEMALIFITHDLGIVAQIADSVAVMYAGKIVELGSLDEIFYNPLHPYTKALLASVPRLDYAVAAPLVTLAGCPPVAGKVQGRCSFLERCPSAMRCCAKFEPSVSIIEGRQIRCWNSGEKNL